MLFAAAWQIINSTRLPRGDRTRHFDKKDLARGWGLFDSSSQAASSEDHDFARPQGRGRVWDYRSATPERNTRVDCRRMSPVCHHGGYSGRPAESMGAVCAVCADEGIVVLLFPRARFGPVSHSDPRLYEWGLRRCTRMKR